MMFIQGCSDVTHSANQKKTDEKSKRPVITSHVNLTTEEETPITITLDDLTIDWPSKDKLNLIIREGDNYASTGTTVTPALDYNGALDIWVAVTDGIATSDDKAIQVSVTPVNDPPKITGQATLTVSEGGTLTISLNDLTIFDPDNYPKDLSMNIGSGPNYTVNISNNSITPDVNFNGTLTIPISVNDGAIDSNTFDLKVLVSAVNNQPTWDTNETNFSIKENVIATIATISASDVDSSNLKYTIYGGNNATLFEYNQDTHELLPRKPLNYEDFANPSIGEPDPVLQVTVGASDGENTITKALFITLLNEDEPPIDTTIPPNPVKENTTFVTRLSAIDPDGYLTKIVLESSKGDTRLFTIDQNNDVSFITAPDYETWNITSKPYEIWYSFTDQTHSPISNSISFTVENVKELPVFTIPATNRISVLENTTFITDLMATDLNGGGNMNYSIVGGASAAMISLVSGNQLVFSNAPDYELSQSHEIVVAATNLEGTTNLNLTATVLNSVDQLSPTFGTNGVAFYDSSQHDRGLKVTTLSTATSTLTLVSGYSETANVSGSKDAKVWCFDEFGNPCSNFGINGVYTYDGGLDDSANGITVINSRILVTGYSTSSTSKSDMMVWCLESNASPCANFGTNGIYKFDGRNADDIGYDIITATSNASTRIYVAGSSVPANSTSIELYATVWCLDLNGNPFTNFGLSGVFNYAGTTSLDEATSIVSFLKSDGTTAFVVAGNQVVSGKYNAFATCINTDSSFCSTTYGTSGVATFIESSHVHAYRAIYNSDNNQTYIVGASQYSTGETKGFLWCLDMSGKGCIGFGVNGVLTFYEVDSGAVPLNTTGSDVTFVATNGIKQLFVAGYSLTKSANANVNVWCFELDTTPCTGYGINGVFTYDGVSQDRAYGITVADINGTQRVYSTGFTILSGSPSSAMMVLGLE